jgi:hypothetical protein
MARKVRSLTVRLEEAELNTERLKIKAQIEAMKQRLRIARPRRRRLR